MTWGAIGGAAASAVVGGLMSDGGDKNGGAGAQQQTRDPWRQAQPWLMQNIARGQGLQAQYEAAPFNQAQLTAYGNMGAQSDYMRNLVPGLLGTTSRQQLGFDRGNPNARPEAYNFNATAAPGGLLGSLTGRAIGNYGAANPLPQAPQQQQQRQGTFTQQTEDPYNAWQMKKFRGSTGLNADPSAFGALRSDGGPAAFNGGYGEFRYGMDAPAPGTQAFRDMNEFFAYGGADPYNLYGKGPQAQGLLGGMEVAGGPGSGGIGAAGGAGAGSAAGGAGW